MLLQKSRSFAFAPYIAESCRRLAAQSLEDSDRYLPAIIEAQRIAECVDSLVDDPAATRAAALEALNNDFAALKSSLAFPLSKSRKRAGPHSWRKLTEQQRPCWS